MTRMENLFSSLELMWKGMAGIFVVIILITLIVLLLTKLDSNEKDKDKSQ